MSEESFKTYRKKYGTITVRNLTLAAHEDSPLLIDMVESGRLDEEVISNIIIALGEMANKKYYLFIRERASDKSPVVREASYHALENYFNSHVKFQGAKQALLNRLMAEEDPRLVFVLNGLIGNM